MIGSEVSHNFELEGRFIQRMPGGGTEVLLTLIYILCLWLAVPGSLNEPTEGVLQ